MRTRRATKTIPHSAQWPYLQNPWPDVLAARSVALEPRFLRLSPLSHLAFVSDHFTSYEINCPPAPITLSLPPLSVSPTAIFPATFCVTFKVSFLLSGPAWSSPAPPTPEGLNYSGILPNSYLRFKIFSKATYSKRIMNHESKCSSSVKLWWQILVPV